MKNAASPAARCMCALVACVGLASAALIGCAGGSPFPSAAAAAPRNCVVAIAPDGTETIGVNLANPNESVCTDPTYLAVTGYFAGTKVVASQVISLTASSTDQIQFSNLDLQPHTANDLGAWSGAYPAATPNPNRTASPAGTDISNPKFTTGAINGGATSLSYVADVPGVYVFGCAFHYNSNNMRTVIIVM